MKHEPTLVSAIGRRRRIDFYKYAIDCAAELGSDCVSLWSGVLRRRPERRPQLDCTAAAMDRLVEGLGEVLDYAAQRRSGDRLRARAGNADRLDARRSRSCSARIDAPNLRLTLDVGHLQCQGETPIAEVIRRWAPRLVNVHIEDMRRGVHEHLMFGEGEIDFPPVLQALADVGLHWRRVRGAEPPQPRRAGGGAPGVRVPARRCMDRSMSVPDRLASKLHRCRTVTSLDSTAYLTLPAMPKPVILLSIPGLREKDVAVMPKLRTLMAGGEIADLTPSFPCVTCPVQADMTTGSGPAEHGVVANGFYWRDRRQVEMWTAPNDCIERPQIWDLLSHHGRGLTSAVWFPLHSKGCEADYVCTPAPIHNPDGSESLWCYTRPMELYGDAARRAGPFSA